MKTQYAEAISALNHSESVLLLSHLRPDGDAYGSCLGLGLSLSATGKKVLIFNQDGLNTLYTFLPFSERILRTPQENPPAGLLLALDTSTKERLGATCLSWNREVDWNIDHHESNTRYGLNQLVIPEEPAASAILTDLILEAGWPMPPEAASALYVGIMTDTGCFRHRGTSAHTFEQAALLISHGADPAYLAQQCYQTTSLARFRLQQMATSSLQLEQNGLLAFITLVPEQFAQCNALPEDTEGLVEMPLAVRDVQVSALFEHRQDGSLKVSLRSKGKINVNALAGEFGGGGHPAAAGINFKKDGLKNREFVLARLRQAVHNPDTSPSSEKPC